MGTGDQASNKAEEFKGEVKQTVGRATDDEQLEREGAADKVKGKVKQAGEKAKEAAEQVAESAKAALKKDR